MVDPRLGALVAIFVAIAALGALNGFVLLQGELPLALARHNLFPRWFAAAEPLRDAVAHPLLSSGLATLLVLTNYSRGLAGLFQFMLLVTTSVTIIFYIAGALAGLKLVRGAAGLRRGGARRARFIRSGPFTARGSRRACGAWQ